MARDNQISIGCRVEGCHGPLVANPDPTKKRRVRSRVVGTVRRAEGSHKWTVVFDYDQASKVVKSSSLKVVPVDTGVPVHELTNGVDPAAGVVPAVVVDSAAGVDPAAVVDSAAADDDDTTTTATATTANASLTAVEDENREATVLSPDRPLLVSDGSTVVTNDVDPSANDAVEENEDLHENNGAAPNNDFCFDEDDFLQFRNNVNDATRHQGA